MNVKSARIVQLCPVSQRIYMEEDDDTLEKGREQTVVALALIALAVESEDHTDRWEGQAIWPVVCGFGDAVDHLRLKTPPGFGDGWFTLFAYGDEESWASLGRRRDPE